MDAEIREWVERKFRVPESRANKVTTLADAVERFVRPGDTVQLGVTHVRTSPAVFEIVRRFYGSEPGFTFAAVSFSTPFSPLVQAGLARKIVTSWAGDSYITPGPNAACTRAWDAGVIFEHWSIMTFAQRLDAGARGVGWTSTRSLRGSDMERNDGVRVMEDGTVLIPALTPDVAIFHAPAADEHGNVLFSPPLFENVHGALAARRGAIVTVEKIVDTAYVREHAHRGHLPATAVAAVVEAPYGAHPGGVRPAGLDGIRSYGEDYEFWMDMRRQTKDPADFDAWIKEWILEPGSHEAYVEKLGRDRLARLEARARSEGWREDLPVALEGVALDDPPNAIETAIVGAAREVARAIRENGYTHVLAGAGMANLAAWQAAYALAESGVVVDLVAEMGLAGYWPVPGEPFIFNHRNFPRCTMLADIETALGVLIGGARARSIAVLGAAQVDKAGNINSTLIPGKQLLMGSGGANDVITAGSESLVVVTHDRARLLDRVPYVTGPGDRVQTLVTTLGVMRKDDGEFVLTGVFGEDVDATVRECVERTGWKLRVARDVARLEPPARDEVRMLRVMDPKGWFRS